jgi:hypothetical protein
MNPSIELIQLTVRIERDEAAKRHQHLAHSDDFADETPVRSAERDNRIKHIFKLPRRRPQCECA